MLQDNNKRVLALWLDGDAAQAEQGISFCHLSVAEYCCYLSAAEGSLVGAAPKALAQVTSTLTCWSLHRQGCPSCARSSLFSWFPLGSVSVGNATFGNWVDTANSPAEQETANRQQQSFSELVNVIFDGVLEGCLSQIWFSLANKWLEIK